MEIPFDKLLHRDDMVVDAAHVLNLEGGLGVEYCV